MGFDFLDMLFRLERQFGLKIPRGDLQALFTVGDPPDATVGDLYAYVCGRLWGPGAVRQPDGALDRDIKCSRCGYNLRGLTDPVTCPECGTDPGPGGPVWAGVRQVLGDVLGFKPQEIVAGAWLRKDLGVG